MYQSSKGLLKGYNPRRLSNNVHGVSKHFILFLMQSWLWPVKAYRLVDFFGPHIQVLVVKKGGNKSTSSTFVLEFGLAEPNETHCHLAMAIGKALVIEHGRTIASYR